MLRRLIIVFIAAADAALLAPLALRPARAAATTLHRVPSEPVCGLFSFLKGKKGGGGGELAQTADFVEAIELTLTGGQRRKLAKAADSKRLQPVAVDDAGASAAEISESLAQQELVRVEFRKVRSYSPACTQRPHGRAGGTTRSKAGTPCAWQVSKKPDAMLLANELAGLTNAAVAECNANVALLYRPSKKNIYRV